MNKLESVVIVYNDYGSVSTIRFEDSKDDKIISATGKAAPYQQIEKHIAEVLND